MRVATRSRLCLLLALGAPIAAVPYTVLAQSIQTIVGGGSNDGRLATTSALTPTGVAASASGDVFVSDPSSQRVYRIDHANGTIATFAGNGIPSYGGDGGAATKASIYNPYGLALDAAGNLFIAEASNCIIRRVEAGTGVISTVAGGPDGRAGGDGGPATLAQVCSRAIALDAAGNLFIADTSGHRVRRVDKASGIITTLAGDGTAGFSGDGGPATQARLRSPQGIALDAAGNVFVADTENQRVRRVDATTKTISTIAGTGETGFSGDGGPATLAQLAGPSGIFIDTSGRLYISDFLSRTVRSVDGGIITTLAGNGGCCTNGDGGPATLANLNGPIAVAFAGGNLVIADLGDRRVRRVSGQTGLISTIAGIGQLTFLGDGGPATAAAVYGPDDVAHDAAGNLYIADDGDNRIRKVSASTGIITTIAGRDGYGFAGDGEPATTALLFSPSAVAVDRTNGDVYIADRYNHRIRRVAAATGIITTIAGVGETGFSGDGGPATAARMNEPYDIELGAGGLLYFADFQNHRVRRVELAAGLITTIAGNGAAAGPVGDGGPATLAVLARPDGLALDGHGNLLIAEYDGQRIRRMSLATGTITTLAGDGEIGGGVDIPATQARFYRPGGLAVDAAGNIYVPEIGGSTIKRIDAASGILTLVTGAERGFTGDNGPASAAAVLFPRSLTIDAAGNIVFADTGNNRVRRVSACLAVTAPALGVPTPNAVEVSTSPTLGWSAVAGAFRYDVYLGSDAAATTLLAAEQTPTSITPANLLPGTKYFWRVVAKGDPFCTPASTATSEVRAFTTSGGCTAPGAFAGVSPADGAGVTPPVALTWQAAAGAGSYDVYLGGSSPPPLAASGVAGTSFSPTSLSAGSTYVWNVVAHASCDPAKTTASAVRSFRVAGGCAAPGAFSVTAPTDGAAGVASSTTLSWSASANASAYDLYLGTEANPPLYLVGLASTSVAVTGLAPGAAYRARVVARTSCDAALTAQTSLVSFTVAGACVTPGPTTFSFVPATVGSGQTYVVVWKDAPGLDAGGTYIVERSLFPSFSPLIDSQQVSRTSATFLAKGAGTVHHRVRAVAGCDAAKTGPFSDVRPVGIVAASPNVIFTVQPQAVLTAVGEPLEERKTSFTLENISESPVQILLGRLELSPSIPFFYLADPLGGDTAFVTLEPRKPKSFDVRFSGPSSAKEAAYQGLVFASSTSQGLAITPYAFVNLKVGSSDSATPEIRFCAGGACTATEYAAFPGFAGDDRARPPIEIDVKNPGSTPMQLGAEIGPEVWLSLEPGWNAAPIAPGASRKVRLSTNRSRAPSGSALPRYTYLTLRSRGGQTARLLVQDNDLPRLGTGRSALASRSQRSYMVPSVVNATSRIGNTFVSRLRLSNSGSQDVQAELLFTPSGADGFDGNAVRSATVLVPKNDLVNLTDPLVQLFGLTPPIAGTLEVRADADRIGFLTVTSLVDAPAKTGGTFGFQLPTLQRGEGARLGTGHVIPGITASAEFRTNLILAETTGIEATRVSIVLYDGEGRKLGESEETVPRYGQRQISGVVAALGGGSTLAAGSLEIDVVSGGGSVAGLVTVIDNSNDDAVTYVGRPAAGAAPAAMRGSGKARWALATGTIKSVVPAIVSGFPTFPGTAKPYTFRSQMGFVAGRAQAATFRLTYVDLSTGLTHQKTVTVQPRKTVEYQNVVEQLFGIPSGARSQGPVLVESDGGGILYCKVYSGTDSGSLGDTFPVVAVPGESLTGSSSQIVLALDGLEQSTDPTRGTRSNLILNEVLGEETTVVIALYEAGNRSVPIAETELTLRPLEKAQLSSVFSGIGLSEEMRKKDRANVLLTIRPKSGRGLVSGVVTTIDNKTGDTKNSLLTPGGGTPATGGAIGF